MIKSERDPLLESLRQRMVELDAIRNGEERSGGRLALLVLRQSLADLRPALEARKAEVGTDIRRLHAATAAAGSYARTAAMTANPRR